MKNIKNLLTLDFTCDKINELSATLRKTSEEWKNRPIDEEMDEAKSQKKLKKLIDKEV